MKQAPILILLLWLFSCSSTENSPHTAEPVGAGMSTKAEQDSIIVEHLQNGAWKKG